MKDCQVKICKLLVGPQKEWRALRFWLDLPDKYRDMVVREISVLRATEPTESVESVDTLCLGEKDKRMRAVCPFHNPLMLCMLGAFGDLGVRGFRGSEDKVVVLS